MAIVFEALISVYGSARQVEAELSHPALWRWVRRLAQKRVGVRLPRKPMRRHHYLYIRNRYLTDPAILEQLGDIHRRAAARQALQLGLLDINATGSWTHPSLDRLLYGDGKVITPLYRAKPGDARVDHHTGEIRSLRAEADAALHFEGTGETAWGTKFVLLAARGTTVHSRIILDAAYVPKPGAEAATAMECLQRTTPLVPGAQAVVYDTALRGVHHQTILRELGLLPINRVTAAKASSPKPRRDKRDRRVEKTVLVETKTIEQPDGSERQVSLYARGGAICVGVLDVTGDMQLTPLQRIRTHRNAGKAGYRWYNDYLLPHDHGGGTVTVRLHGDQSDKDRGFNRAENVRPIPPGDPDFTALFRRRNDAESINRALEDTMWLRRAHSLGHRRQLLNLLGYALSVNSLALARHRAQTSLRSAA
jgi:hypothetical protein